MSLKYEPFSEPLVFAGVHRGGSTLRDHERPFGGYPYPVLGAITQTNCILDAGVHGGGAAPRDDAASDPLERVALPESLRHRLHFGAIYIYISICMY